MRASLVGAGAGALAGGISRAAVAAFHLTDASQAAPQFMLTAAVIGVVIGAAAGVTGKPVLGAAVGAALSALVFLATLPIVAIFHVLGTLTAPSIWEVAGAGALAGGVGGAAGQMATRRTRGNG